MINCNLGEMFAACTRSSADKLYAVVVAAGKEIKEMTYKQTNERVKIHPGNAGIDS